MNWSKYYIYPRGYVDSSFDALNIKRYSVQFQIHGKHKYDKTYRIHRDLGKI